jgi:hypothetical protein
MSKLFGLKGSAALEHQIVIAYLNTNINNQLFFSEDTRFENTICTTETKFHYNSKNWKEPDVLIFDKSNSYNIFTWIEICKTSMVSEDKEKIDLIFKKNKHLKEAFVFDYESNNWYKRTRTKDFFKSDNSSFLRNTNLSELIYTINRNIFR